MSTCEASDEDALLRIAQGHVAPVGELYDRYASSLFPMALRILHDRTEAEDVLHDAFVTVVERAGQYVAERGSVGAWLATLVRNLSIDRLRRRLRQGTLQRDVLAHQPRPPEATPETRAVAASERARLVRALGSLPEAHRTTLERAFFEGLTYAQIAARDGVPIGTVKSRANRAFALLREALGDEGRGTVRAVDAE
ncbi:MAG TPA: sigma-70 family RNA polymerase sigma factor [Polyangiaceae bacterium]